MTGQLAADYSWVHDVGFLRMNTALAIWRDPDRAIDAGLLNPQPPTPPG